MYRVRWMWSMGILVSRNLFSFALMDFVLILFGGSFCRQLSTMHWIYSLKTADTTGISFILTDLCTRETRYVLPILCTEIQGRACTHGLLWPGFTTRNVVFSRVALVHLFCSLLQIRWPWRPPYLHMRIVTPIFAQIVNFTAYKTQMVLWFGATIPAMWPCLKRHGNRVAKFLIHLKF